MRLSHLIKIKEKRKKNREKGIFFAPNWGLHDSIYFWGLYIMNILESFPNFRLYYSWFPRFANSLDGHRGSVKPGNSGLWQSQPPPTPPPPRLPMKDRPHYRGLHPLLFLRSNVGSLITPSVRLLWKDEGDKANRLISLRSMMRSSGLKQGRKITASMI